MKLFQSARALLTLLLPVILVAGLAACGGTGGEADTEAPDLKLNPVPVSTIERTRILSGTMEPGATVVVTADTEAVIEPATVTAGTWTSSIDLVPGVNTVSVKATDATGNNKTLVFPLAYDVVTLDQVLPTTALADQTLRGTLATGASLTATLATVATPPVIPAPAPETLTPVIAGNTWSLDLTGKAEGAYTLTLVGTITLIGTPNSELKTTLPQELVINSSLPVVTLNPATPIEKTVAIDGTVATDSTISEVRLNGVVVDIATITQVSGSGTWNATLSGLQSGRNQIDVTATRTADKKLATARLFVLYQPIFDPAAIDPLP